MNDNNTKRRRIAGRTAALGTILCMAAGTTAALAQSATPNTLQNAAEVGHSTNEWLTLQRENRAAAPTQPVLGDVATLVYQRYVESFNNKIPSSMSSPLGSGAGGGMSGGSGQSAAQ